MGDNIFGVSRMKKAMWGGSVEPLLKQEWELMLGSEKWIIFEKRNGGTLGSGTKGWAMKLFE